MFDLIVCNQNYQPALSKGTTWVKPEAGLDQEYPLYMSDLVDADNPWRHDSQKLAQTIMDLYFERTGPLLIRDEPN
jgi:hypothetical protein